ncbi:hypothetical protein NPS01_34770 [Nocardioides psychrotolerans]|nr:hypothetical protein NPS01_34770 [Nocardioides psychrotolerans]
MIEPESELSGVGTVSRIDGERRLLYITVEWANLRRTCVSDSSRERWASQS